MCDYRSRPENVLGRVPCNLAHNVTIVDQGGVVVTAHLSPDREPYFSRSPAAANRQRDVEWPEHARATRTLEREQHVLELIDSPWITVGEFTDAFLGPFLWSPAYDRGFGTLYTAVYRSAEDRIEYRWPGHTWHQSFTAFEEGAHRETLATGRWQGDEPQWARMA